MSISQTIESNQMSVNSVSVDYEESAIKPVPNKIAKSQIIGHRLIEQLTSPQIKWTRIMDQLSTSHE